MITFSPSSSTFPRIVISQAQPRPMDMASLCAKIKTQFLLGLICLFLFAPFYLKAADRIPVPSGQKTFPVTTPHVVAELIPATLSAMPGKSVDVILHLQMEPGWHTYWLNPGDAGIPTQIEWTLPPGVTAGPIQWPTPEIATVGGETVYGYSGDVYLLTTLTIPSNFTSGQIHAKARWLVCSDVCIPGAAEFTFSLTNGHQVDGGLISALENPLFSAARARLPLLADGSLSSLFDHAVYLDKNLQIVFKRNTTSLNTTAPSFALISAVRFLPEQNNVLVAKEDPQLWDISAAQNVLQFPLQTDGDKPNHLSGILLTYNKEGKFVAGYLVPAFSVSAAPAASAAAPLTGSAPVPSAPENSASSSAAAPALTLLPALFAAFVGGLILNLMPCVLPVLSLKVFSLVKSAQEKKSAAWLQGLAFTAGVVISFWILAGLLLGLRAAGEQLGWGFQMQSPGFVLFLTLLFFVLALNLLGVFEIGTGLVGLDAKVGAAAGKKFPPSLTSGLYGALAVGAATPCTAPFMGSALGFAAQQPAWVALLIFTALALGLAAPYLLLTAFPAALRFLPKPGAWMEAFKQLMGFFLLATVVWMLYVFQALTSPEQLIELLAVGVAIAFVAWIYGRWSRPEKTASLRWAALLIALAGLGTVLAVSPRLIQENSLQTAWQPWTPDAVSASLRAGHPVFVDFTAAWCLSCKVNERVALEDAAVLRAFHEKGVVLLRGDWTKADPIISNTLQKYQRDGVPLYLYFTPGRDLPQVLPEVLTPGIVLDTLNTSNHT